MIQRSPIITLSEYAEHARRTRRTDLDKTMSLLNAAMGLVGEAGEVCDYIKKVVFQGHPLDGAKVAEELGDLSWYKAYIADLIETPLDEILMRNVDKLKLRYPDKFSIERSVNRTV